jgi:hypothetical protein
MNDLICQKCLTRRSDDVLGMACRTPGCDGTIEEAPAYSTLVDVLPEPMTCPRRTQQFGPWDHRPELDHWEKFKSNGNRVCSFCGSMHPDDFFAVVKAAAEAPEDGQYHQVADIEPSDKGYKIYVHQPGVRNAHEGAIKFYKYHLPDTLPEGTAEQFLRAVEATKRRFLVYMADNYPQQMGHA